MSATGSEIKYAGKLATVWGTPVAVGAGDGFLILPSSTKRDQPFTVDDSLGLGWPTDGDLGEIKVDGEIKGYLRYDSLDLLIGLLMGAHSLAYTVPGRASQTASAGSATTLTGAAGMGTTQYVGKYVTITAGTNAGKTRKIISHTDTVLTFATMTALCDATSVFTISGAATTHTYTLAENTDGLFATFCAKIGVLNVEEITTAKVSSVTLKGGTGKPIDVSFKILAHDRNVNTDSGTNTNATILNITFPETANRMLYRQIKFLMNAASGADFSDVDYPTGDRFYPTEFEFGFERKLTGVYGTGGSYDNIDEPTNDGNPTTSLKFKLGRHTAASVALIAAKEASTAQKCKIVFTGGLLSGATYRALTLEIPNAKFSNAEAPMVPGILAANFDMFCLGCTAAPTGMSGLTAPFRLTLVNASGADKIQQGN